MKHPSSHQYTAATRRHLSGHRQRYALPTAVGAEPAMAINHFTVANEAPGLQAQAWREYVGRIMDVPVSRSQRKQGFRGEIATYVLKDLIFLDSRTDAVCQVRSPGNISRDGLRDYVFHVAIEGIIETEVGGGSRKAAQFVPGILALDMNQTMRMVRPASARVLAFFLPRHVVAAAIPDAESIHGRVVNYSSPLTRLLFDQLMALCRTLSSLPPSELDAALRRCGELILAAFAKQTHLESGQRAAVRAAWQDKIRLYIDANLYRQDLTPEHILQTFPLSRPSLYRLFEAEGGLAAYVRNCRLREAANELVLAPETAIAEIARDLAFQSPAHFSRVFRSAYGMAPLDFRAMQLDWLRP
ncbi:helix-turn-helix domain-containing protein [Duganella sp. HH105]|uniref:helix-turn-helix domain-containing protein n=1 Tax=Duganella sp. HH105 TaxID=1781067 RepID=UPI000893BC03|nr:helix-turn-helix domain-containing protein [Duganella sp. HH105]OEZ60644.1 transcriptional activator NphR [Duganella sp. HH105]